ncbi:MAG TPA: hypothetical protein DCP92_20605, partial [Nitrospiraceae bacterium]|nr:hypothetical protein [Nitrospiraceae bacterium]
MKRILVSVTIISTLVLMLSIGVCLSQDAEKMIEKSQTMMDKGKMMTDKGKMMMEQGKMMMD